MILQGQNRSRKAKNDLGKAKNDLTRPKTISARPWIFLQGILEGLRQSGYCFRSVYASPCFGLQQIELMTQTLLSMEQYILYTLLSKASTQYNNKRYSCARAAHRLLAMMGKRILDGKQLGRQQRTTRRCHGQLAFAAAHRATTTLHQIGETREQINRVNEFLEFTGKVCKKKRAERGWPNELRNHFLVELFSQVALVVCTLSLPRLFTLRYSENLKLWHAKDGCRQDSSLTPQILFPSWV